jgi:hypothetical protein
MKNVMVFILLAIFLIVEIKAQDIFSSATTIDIQSSASGIYLNPNEIIMGGQEKTASGTLRVLVIFVRY